MDETTLLKQRISELELKVDELTYIFAKSLGRLPNVLSIEEVRSKSDRWSINRSGIAEFARLRLTGTIGIRDDFDNEFLVMSIISNAVNYLLISNSATNVPPALQSGGDDTNVGLGLVPKGTGGVIVAPAGTAPNASAIFQVDSTTKGLLVPRMTSGQRDAIGSPAAGLVIYNTTTNKLNVYTTAWEAVTSG